MVERMPEKDMAVFTIGHSNHPIEKVVDLLRQHEIEVLADVRSSPYSQYATHFNKEAFHCTLEKHGIRYLYLGDVVGGMPESGRFYDDEGYILYHEVAQSEKFQNGISRLLKGVKSYRVALLCGEENPTNCHRRLLIGRVLCERGAKVFHIRADGRIQSEEEVAQEEEFQRSGGQLSLFEDEEMKKWRSTRSVSRKKARNSSSARSNR